MNISPPSSSQQGVDQAVLYSVQTRLDHDFRHSPFAEGDADKLKDWLVL